MRRNIEDYVLALMMAQNTIDMMQHNQNGVFDDIIEGGKESIADALNEARQVFPHLFEDHDEENKKPVVNTGQSAFTTGAN